MQHDVDTTRSTTDAYRGDARHPEHNLSRASQISRNGTRVLGDAVGFQKWGSSFRRRTSSALTKVLVARWRHFRH